MITPVDFAFVAAKLHGMRSRMYEQDRLTELCRLRDIYEMMTAIFPGEDIRTRTGFEARLSADHVGELHRVQVFLEGANRRFFDWQLERYRLENLKVLLRGWKAKMSAEDVRELMIDLPSDYSLPAEEVLRTEKLSEVVRLMPSRAFARGIRRGVVQFHDTNRLFYIDAGLDAEYFEELLRRTAQLGSADRTEVAELIEREVLIYNVMFIMRARLNYDVDIEDLREFLVTATSLVSSAGLQPMLDASTFEEMFATMPNSRALMGSSSVPSDLADIERRLWTRMYRAANRVFYNSDFHMGCVVGFYYLKRIELNNLIRIAELLRQEAPAEAIIGRLIVGD